MNAKKASVSHTIMTELILPNDTNMLNNLMGGRMLHWMDIAAAVSAQKHCGCLAVTASVDSVSFKHAVKLGDVISIEAQVTRAFNTSVEVRLVVSAQNFLSGTTIKSNEAYYTFVGIDANNKPQVVPELIPETAEEIALYEGAMQRRQLRLILSGKMKIHDATELKDFFYGVGAH